MDTAAEKLVRDLGSHKDFLDIVSHACRARGLVGNFTSAGYPDEEKRVDDALGAICVWRWCSDWVTHKEPAAA